MEVVKDLTCPICLEFYSHPVILPCSHMMCKQPCAEQLFEGNFIRCPVCRDNCYVSGGLPSLPRVITIENIIEKVRAEKKKRNAINAGQGLENSFDDVFSDVTSEHKEIDRTRTDSLQNYMQLMCNSPIFPERRKSPVSFSTRDSIDVSNPGTFRHLPRSSSSPVSEASLATSVSPQTSHQGSANDPSTESDPRMSVVHHPGRGTKHRNNGLSINTSFASVFHPPLAAEELSSTSTRSSYETRQIPSDDSIDHFLCHSTPRTDNTHTIQNVFSLRISNSGMPVSNVSQTSPYRTHADFSGSFSSFNMSLEAAGFDHSSVIDNPENQSLPQITEPATPRVALRNIRLCHEQSLANLKACSDSIKALQKSRPSLRYSQSDSLGSVRSYTFNSIGSESADAFLSTSNQNPIPNSSSTNLYLSRLNKISSSLSSCIKQNDSYLSDITNTLVISSRQNSSEMNHTLSSENHNFDQNTTQSISVNCEENETNGKLLAEAESTCGQDCNSLTDSMHGVEVIGDVAAVKDAFEKGRTDINKECDELVAEIESKRYHFLLHIDDERKRHHQESSGTTGAMHKLLASSQELSQFVEAMLESSPETILDTASSLLDSLSSAVTECQTCLHTSTASSDCTCDEHSIDTRLQRTFTQRIEHLSLPHRPSLDVCRCTRNASTVALVLEPPALGDVIDHYEISYCSDEQKALGIQERYFAQMPNDFHLYGVQTDAFPVILIENFRQAIHYFFCACAVNKRGKSPSSDYIECKTLGERDCVVPVPSVIENQCRVSSTSVTMICPSVATVTSHQRVHHCLLQKSNNGACVWKGLDLTSDKNEVTVERIQPGTQNHFCVIAYNDRGECQVSNKVRLTTFPSCSPTMDDQNQLLLYN